MTNLILLCVSLLLGIWLRRLRILPDDAPLTLNMLILYVPLPAVTFLTIPLLEWRPELLVLCLVSWITFGVAYYGYRALGRRLHWDPRTVGCLTLTTGLGNTSFVGFPVIEALFGPEALRYAILVDMGGSFVIVTTFAVWVAAATAGRAMPARDIFRKVFFFPPFIALIAAMLLSLIGWKAEGETKLLLGGLAGILTPLALISVGLQLRWRDIGADLNFLLVGLGYKLLLAPLIIFVFFKVIGIPPKIFRVALLEAAMAPNITASILAASYNLHPRLASMLVGVGVPLSFLSLGIWYLLL